MSKKRLLKEISEAGADRRSETLEDIKLRYPQYAAEEESAQELKARRKNAFLTKIIPAASAVVCAVAITVSVLISKYAYDNSRYGYTEVTNFHFVTLDPGYTIKDYGRDNGLNYKSLDNWYEFAEDVISYCMFEDDTELFVGVREFMYNPNTDDLLYMDIIPANIKLNTLDKIYDEIPQIRDCGNFSVKWATNPDNQYFGMAQYDGYKYYIIFNQPSSEEILFDTFVELLG